MYSVIYIFAIAFLALGLILAILCVISFYSRNMAEVYDALYDRGYTERMEKRKNKKAGKRKASTPSDLEAAQIDASRSAGMTSSFPVPSDGTIPQKPVTTGNLTRNNVQQTVPLNQNRGQTVPLNPTQGQTVPLSQNQDFTVPLGPNQGYTVPLDANNTPSPNTGDFTITKNLHYSYTDETIN